jgi:hypothetical protein
MDLKRWNGVVWISLIWLRIGATVMNLQVLEWLYNWRLLKKTSTPSS